MEAINNIESFNKNYMSDGRKEKKRTDILFLIIFITFNVGLFGCAIYTAIYADMGKILHGFDSFGNTCGKDNTKSNLPNIPGLSNFDATNREKVLYYDWMNPIDAVKLCVSVCPKIKVSQITAFEDYTDYCMYNITAKPTDEKYYSAQGPCPSLPIYPSNSIFNRCVPKASELVAFTSFLKSNSLKSFGERLLADVIGSYQSILILSGLAFLIGFVVIILLYILTPILVWAVTFLSVLSLLVASGFLWWQYAIMTGRIPSTDSPYIDTDKNVILGFAIVATIATIILLIIIIAIRKQLLLVVALFKETSYFIRSKPSIMIQPLLTAIVLIITCLIYAVFLIAIRTAATPTLKSLGKLNIINYTLSNSFYVIWYIVLFATIWWIEFILSCQQMIIGSVVAAWYFQRDKSKVYISIFGEIKNIFVYYIGSIALGSLVILIVTIPRFILSYIKETCTAAKNPVAQFLLKCCICCLWCLEKFIRFLNKSAYVIIAIESIHFCGAARKAFQIITSNVIRVAALNMVGAFVIFLGKLSVVALSVTVSVAWFQKFGIDFNSINSDTNNLQLENYWVPLLIVSLFAYVIGHCIFTVYDTAIDAMLLCFCEDCNMNDGSPEKPYYMRTQLMEAVNLHNDTTSAQKYQSIETQ
ncbi:Choline transporter-like protein 3 [Intoshia linei]|uniref:Choline transporter-like protein n=1 Tax=Intoshia linei TaxID=1819745 RepID=A0A177B1P5_9BILA|nr:Choline transporter-like protein 3 [Intoshia linei]